MAKKRKPVTLRGFVVAGKHSGTLAASPSGNVILYHLYSAAVMSCGHGYTVKRAEVRVLRGSPSTATRT